MKLCVEHYTVIYSYGSRRFIFLTVFITELGACIVLSFPVNWGSKITNTLKCVAQQR